MNIREADIKDIRQMQQIRNSVKENILSDPAKITSADYADYITRRGKGWVCEDDGMISGFAVADLKEHNIWALFVRPESERKGIGIRLHVTMMNWYFGQTRETVWLSTSPGTRAESFYRAAGWTEAGKYGKEEIKFEMTYDEWMKKQQG
jgi:GNAT superfamily N-acetyltransferase